MAADPFDLSLELESAWLTGIPKKLQGMKRRELVAVMRLAATENGVSFSAAASALGQSPSGISKIAAKLVQVKWVTITRATDNHKQKLMTATSKAQLAMVALGGNLGAVILTAVVPRRRSKADRDADGARRLYGDRSLHDPPSEGQEA